MKTAFRFLLFFSVMLLVSCSNGPEKKILGRWQEVGTPAIGTFHEDGTVVFNAGKDQVAGKFSFTAPDKLKVVLMAKEEMTVLYDVTIEDNKMTLKDPEGTVLQYLRID